MAKRNFSHQMHLYDPAHNRPVVIIGGGAVGSFTAFLLAKAGVTDITVMDHDTVDSHNDPMSLYRREDLGRLKVEALADTVLYLTGVSIKSVARAYEGEQIRNATVICCPDKMLVRSDAWEQVKKQFSVDLFVDTRVEAAYGEVIAVSPRVREERKLYEALLFPDEEAKIQNCGMHGIVYGSTGVAAATVSIVTRFWQTGQKKWRHAVRYDKLETVF